MHPHDAKDVGADRRVDVGKRLGKRYRFGVTRHIASTAYGYDFFNASRVRSRNHRLGFAGVFLTLDMGVTIDQHNRGLKLLLCVSLDAREENSRRVDFVTRGETLTPRSLQLIIIDGEQFA